MSQLDQIVNINISQQTKAVPQKGFGIPVFMGSSNRFVDAIRYYTDTASMIADGFLISDPEYVRAAEAFEQELSPVQVGIGKYTAPVLQIDTLSFTAVNTHLYTITINGVDYSYTSDGSATVSEIVAGLLAAVNADTNSPAVATGSTTLILTAKVAGSGFTTTTLDVNISIVHTQANHSIVNDIVTMQAASDIWYGLGISSNLAADIEQVAAYIETQKKIFLAVTGDAGVPTTSSTDVGSILKGKGYNRSGLIYSATPTTGLEGAWMGGVLPTTPGAATWKFKTAVGIGPDSFSQTQRNILIGLPGIPGKNVNIYENVGGVNIFEEGFMASGQFIDITIGLDWLESTMQTNVFTVLVNALKIPYTDIGASMIENAIRQTLKQGDDLTGTGLLDHNSFSVTVPPVLSVPQSDRANRILPDIKFSARLAGAFHFIQINGTVSV